MFVFVIEDMVLCDCYCIYCGDVENIVDFVVDSVVFYLCESCFDVIMISFSEFW